MQIGFINSFASWWFNKRLSDLRLFLKNPVNTQEEQLLLLVNRGKNTQFGKEYGFDSINSITGYSEQVPLQNYQTHLPYIEQMLAGKADILWPGKVKWFAKSSGTTAGRSKFIPVTREALEWMHYQGGKDTLAFYLEQHPESKILNGKVLKLGGSKQLTKQGDIQTGDLSAILIDNMPFWANLLTLPDKKTALIPDWEKKLDRILQETLPANLTGLAGVPSWMLLVLQEALKRTGKSNILEIWPGLEVFFHGGVSFLPYKETYQKLIPGNTLHYREVYNASEGFFALQDKDNQEDMLLMLDYGIFYEFIPMSDYEGIHSQKVIPLKEVKTGINYAMVITTSSGLWRYIIGDTVRFTSTQPYRIKITGRTKHFINAFGEEVIIENADTAIEKAARLTGASIKEYTAAPIFMQEKKKGAHEWLIEFDKEPEDFEQFARILDQELQKLNSDYQAKRYKDITMGPPVVHKAKKNLFYRWMATQNKLGGQNKVPRLSNDRKMLEALLELNF